MAILKKRLTDILIEGNYISKEQLKKALDIQKKTAQELRTILVKDGFIEERELLGILSRHLYIPFFDLSRYKIDSKVALTIPEKIAKQYNIVPIALLGSVLTVAMSDPLNIFALDDIKAVTVYDIDSVIASETEIAKVLNQIYSSSDATQNMDDIVAEEEKQGVIEVVKEDQLVNIGDALKDSEKPPIVKIVDLMISEAVKKRASDIHIEPAERDLKIRYRIDGQLYDAFRLPKKNQNAILARIKIISGLNITESRVPQDGRFKARLPNKELDFRVSGLPTTFGQKFVLRALDKSRLNKGLDNFDISPEPKRLFKESVTKPYGMILVTGPTGSGKSTTLYSILNQLNTPEKNIVTIEDPVEYQIEGITQIQVKPEIGLTFASGLRSVLRQSPDIIMVGEIRDSETADIAVKASLTGQLVLSTLHTNDACGAITRLVDMGVEPFLVASSIVSTSAQRLCRRICPKCKEVYNISKQTLEKIGMYDMVKGKGVGFYRGKGCEGCNNTGYFERIAIHEVLSIDDSIKDLIIKQSSSDRIKEFAVKEKSFKTLWDDATNRFLGGIITLEEVIRITSQE